MRQFGAWGWGIALLIGLNTPTFAADDDYQEPRSHSTWGSGNNKGLLDKWFGNDDKPKKADKKTTSKDDKDKEPAASEPTSKPAVIVDEAAAERKREQDTLLRRLQVCDKLQDIAFQTHDAELQHRADQLAERAQAAYSQRIAHLPCSGACFESDEQTVQKHLGAGAASSERQAGTPPSTASGNDRNGQAAREDRP